MEDIYFVQRTFEQKTIDSIEIEIDRIIEDQFRENRKQTYCYYTAFGHSDIRIVSTENCETYCDLLYDIDWKEGTWEASDLTITSKPYHRQVPNENGLIENRVEDTVYINMNEKTRDDVLYLWDKWLEIIMDETEGTRLFEQRPLKELMFDEFKKMHKKLSNSSCLLFHTIETEMYFDEYISIVDGLCFEGSHWSKDDFYFDTERVRENDFSWGYIPYLRVSLFDRTKADLAQLWLMWEEVM